MSQAVVSAVIPVHNGERFLRAAIDSALGQSVPTEVIVVNDGSTDGSAAIIASYGERIRSVHQEQRGLGGARNSGIRAARCDWVGFLDADDLWMADKTKRQLAAAVVRPEVSIVFGHCVEFAEPGEQWSARTEPFPARSACAMLARRALFDRVGKFRETREVGEFIEWYSRAQHAGAKELVLDDVVFHRRVHANNMTRVATDKQEQYLAVVRAHLARRRGTS